jgi:putative oxygen-independent coproporphyrinogen III oxidase
MAGLYIHIPFCKSRCIYCDFYSTTHPEMQAEYTAAVCHEMELRKNYLPSGLSTIYIGGGTPSQLSRENISEIFDTIYNKVYHVDKDAEVTMECNPDDITDDFARMLGTMPINRISMGAQTFNDERLHFIRRRHTSEQVNEAIHRLRQAGIDNISIDLMYGFPGETVEEWELDVEKAISLEVEHISAYSLMYEEGTPLYKMLREGKVREVDEEVSRAMYECLIDMLTRAGYEHYEISNFARPGFRSQHNSSYWRQVPYIGIGAAAHSFNIKSRQWNVADMRTYINSIKKDTIPFEQEMLTSEMRYNDTVFTALRTSEGVDLQLLESTFGKEKARYCLEMAKPHLDNNRLRITGNHLTLTRQGIFVSDDIMSDLMIV